MAEKYGEKPKKFTREWWSYYWAYYKWHTIIVVLMAVILAMLLTQCVNRVFPDIGIVYCTTSYHDDEAWGKVDEKLKSKIKDINYDSKITVENTSIQLMNDREYAEQNYASVVKLTGTFSEEANYVYIYDKPILDANIADIDKEETFHTIDVWLNTEVDKNLIYPVDGKHYAVSLKDSKLLRDSGIDGQNLYVMIKYDIGSPYKNEKAFKNAVIIANELIKNK